MNVVVEAESEGISVAMKGEATMVVGKMMPRQLPNSSKGVWYCMHVCEEKEHNLRRTEKGPPGTVGPRRRMTFVIPLSRIT